MSPPSLGQKSSFPPLPGIYWLNETRIGYPESTTPPETPKKIENQIDKLDEKLIFGEIDELTYEIEKIKIKNDLKSLNQLLHEEKIKLSKYLEIQKNIQKKTPINTCSSCNENLVGLEKFCPNCGEKIK